MVLIYWMSLPRKILPDLTHFAMNCSFPTRDSTSLLLAVVLYSHCCNSSLISFIFSLETFIVIVSESNVIPKNSSLVVGGAIFSCEVSTLSYVSSPLSAS